MHTSRAFQVRKVARYIRLYGFERTYTKIRGQRHTRRLYGDLPKLAVKPQAGRVGLVGAGNYAFTTIAYYVNHVEAGAVQAVMDIDLNRAASLARAYGASFYTNDIARLLDDPVIDTIFIASNHASHADYAEQALRAGKAVHVEKPHAVSMDQLERLTGAMVETGRPLAIGYNRPASSLGERLRGELAKESGAGMYNWFIAGHELPDDHWYYRDSEGGRVLGNMCHWIDFLYQLVSPQDRFPVTIVPTRAERSDCDVAASYTFADGTIGVITFSAKGHTFEGVREYFSGHKGNLLASLQDFERLSIDVGHKRSTWSTRHRDHGHRRRIERSMRLSADPSLADTPEYVLETGSLMLATREALERRRPVVLEQPTMRSSRSRPGER